MKFINKFKGKLIPVLSLIILIPSVSSVVTFIKKSQESNIAQSMSSNRTSIFTIAVGDTALKQTTIAATSTLANESPSKIIANNSTLKSWIVYKRADIFLNLDSLSENNITNLDVVKASETSINVRITINNATVNGLPNQSFTTPSLTITNLMSDANHPDTIVKLVNIDAYNTTQWSKIFGNDKGFGEDWKKLDTSTQINQLQTYINNNIDEFFINPAENTRVVVRHFDVTSNTASRVLISYNGWLNNEVTTIESINDIKITLKQTPTSNDFLGMRTFIQDKCESLEPNTKPSLEEVKQWIVDYLNQNKNNIPNTTIPPSGSFSTSDLRFADEKIQILDDRIFIQAGISIGDQGINSTPISLPQIDSIFYNKDSNTPNNKPIVIGGKWQPYVIFGTSGVFLLMLIILLISYIIKRRKKSKVSEN